MQLICSTQHDHPPHRALPRLRRLRLPRLLATLRQRGGVRPPLGLEARIGGTGTAVADAVLASAEGAVAEI